MPLFRNHLGCKTGHQRIQFEIRIPALFVRQLADKGLEHLRTRIGNRVYCVAKAIDQSLVVKRLTAQQLSQIIRNCFCVGRIGHVLFQVFKHLHNLVIGTAVLRPLE